MPATIEEPRSNSPGASKFAEMAKQFMDPNTPPVPNGDDSGERPVSAAPPKAPDPAPAPSVTPESKAPVDDPAPPEIKTEEGKKGWKEWKAKHDQTVKERDEFQKKYTETESSLKGQLDQITKDLAEAKKLMVDPKEIEAMKAERDDLRLRLKIKDVQADPSWASEIEAPYQAALSELRMNVPKDQRDALERLALQPPSEARNNAIDEIVNDLSPLKQYTVAGVLKQIEAVSAKRNALMADQKALAERYDAFQKSRQEQSSAEQRQQLESAIDNVMKLATDPEKGLGVFRPVDSTPEAKKAADAAASKARDWASLDLDPKTRANLAAWAVQGEMSVKLLSAAHEEITKLQAQVNKLTNATPGGGAANGTVAPSKPASFIEAVKAQMNA